MTRRIAASLPLAIVALDVAVVAVLLPDVRLDLGSSPSGGQWVLNAYLLALAVALPACALLPRRPALAAGAVALAAGSVICATAGSTAALVAGRAVQGAGAAALLGGAAALPELLLPALALAAGPLLGGLLAEQNWWHLYFWAGVPLAAAAAAAAALAAPEPDERGRPFPPVYAAGLVAAVVLLVQAEPWGIGFVALVLAALAVGAAVRALPGEALAWGALAGCLTALLFLMPEYFQLVRNLSGSRSGILLLALTLSAVAATALASPLARRIPLLGLGGVVCAVAGLGLLATIEPHSRYALPIAGLGLVGSGLGAATARLPRPSLVSLSAGAAVGLAIAGAGFQIEQASQRDSGATFQEALAAGVGWAALLLIALIGAATLAVWQERRNRGARPTSSEARPAAES